MVGGKTKLVSLGQAVCALSIGFVLVYSSSNHIGNPYAYLSKVFSYGLVSERIGVVAASLLPTVELVPGLMLMFFASHRATGFLTSCVLFCFFAAIQIQALVRGLNISCGCFSSSSDNPINWLTISRTLLCLTVSIVGLFLSRKSSRGTVQ